MLDRVHDLILWAVTAALAAAASGIWWLIRTIFTNREEIRLLREEHAHRDRLRQEDRDRMQNIEIRLETILKVLMEGGYHGN